MKRIILIVGLIILNSPFSILHSQNVIRPKIACPNDLWVNSYNGVLFYQRADLSISNRSMPLEAVFYYNSSSNAINYGYGNGWSLGYEYRYIVDSLGIIIETGDGRQDLFTGANLEAPAGVFSTLTALPTGGYTLTTKEGTVYTFADTLSKRITQLRDRNNNILNFAYTDSNLTAISDVNGRSITMAWTDGLLTTLGTSIDDRQWHYAYDTVGNLVSVTNPMNYTVHYGYNRDNRICRFTDEAGYSTLVTYNDDGMAHRIKTDLTDKSIRYEQSSRQTVIIDYMGVSDSLSPAEVLGHNQFTTYRWDTLGRVIEKTGNCCGYTSKLEYDADNNVIRSEDANGNVTTCTYDGNGNMLSLTDPMGYTESYTYTTDGFNNIATHTDKLGHQYTFSYDVNGNLTAINGPMGSTETFTYNSYGQLLTQTNSLGHTTTYTYDAQGNLTATTNPLGNTVALQYNSLGDITASITPTGARQQYQYDPLRRITATVDPLGNRTLLQYDSRGNITTMIDPLRHQIRTTYDALSRPVTSIDARQAVSRVFYDAKGNTVRAEDALHHAVRMQYNDRNQVVLAIDALGDSTRYSYDAGGNLIAAVMPNGHEVSYTYDANSRLIQVADQYGVMQKLLYDAMGNTIAVINANGDTTRMTYDALGRLIQTTDPLGHNEQYTYDLAGNLLSYTDANGNITTYTYDAIGKLLTETDALNNVTTYTYNADGKLTSVTDANGNTTHYQYDAASQLTKITFANGKTQQFWYDVVGNRIRYKDESGNHTIMHYDANGNMTFRSYPDGNSDQYTYDLLGNMLTANNANANITFTYDANGQILSETLNNATTAYSYNSRQGKINITYPNGRAIEENHDLRGRLTTILNTEGPVATFTYTPTDYLASRTYANGDHTTFAYDPAGRLTKITTLNSQFSILNLNYTYDNSGNILTRLDSLRPDHSETYAYDALHRLTEFRRGVANYSGIIPNPLKQVQYTLDALGNRTSVTTDGTTTTYAHNNTNAYTTVGNETMQYDGNGNMINDGRHTYQYNYRNRMISVDNGSTATYQYDALDRRIRKTTLSDTIYYYYQGIQILEKRTTTDTMVYIYGSGIDDILYMCDNVQDYYYHKNHVGSISAITNNSGTIVETYDYDPYGTPTIYNAAGIEIAVSTIGNTIMFTGREFDYEIEKYYYRARTLHPVLGRFVQHDPLLYVDGLNQYLYVKNNPLNLLDKMGLASEGECDDCSIPPSVVKTVETLETVSKFIKQVTDYFYKQFNFIIDNFGTDISVSKDGKLKFRKPNQKKVYTGGRGRYYYFKNSPLVKRIAKYAKIVDIAETVTRVTTITKLAIHDYCTGEISEETKQEVKEFVKDNVIGVREFFLGWDIGRWADEKWNIGDEAWRFYGMDEKIEKFSNWNYERKYGKNGIVKTPVLQGGISINVYK